MTEEELKSILERTELEKQLNIPKKEGVFSDASTSPAKAALLFFLNSCCAQFDQRKHFSKQYTEPPSLLSIETLKTEILNEKMSDAELHACMREFVDTHNYAPSHLHACAACGIRSYEEEYQYCNVTDESVAKFGYNTAETENLENLLNRRSVE